ncbi:MAG: DUF72 domain-containing protein [Alphaproteobacteria bacterium]
MALAEIRIGTSGWHYDHWVGAFYPAGTKPEDFLAFYAERFDAAEINTSFYQLPSAETLAHWRDTVPAGFRFTAKASRYITHMKKLKDPAASLERFLQRIAVLDPKLGPLLFQLPPNWHADVERLEALLAALPRGRRCAVEFRDPSWWIDAVYAALRRHGAAFCPFELAGREAPLAVTADVVYLRLHGPGAAYQGTYDEARLGAWADRLVAWRAQGREVWCFFDNDEAGYAAHNAARLKALVDAAA